MARTLRRLLGLSTLSSALACSLIVETDEIDAGCPSGTKYCGGKCVDVNDAAYGCTPEECNPCEKDESGDPFGDRYVPACDQGECVIGSCAGDYGCDDCDRHLLTDEQNCGTCGTICTNGSTCSVGDCVGGLGGAGGDAG